MLRKIDFSKATLVVFDKDGTLTTTKSGSKFSKTPDDQKPLWNFDWINPVEQNICLAIASNQGGIAYNLKSEKFLIDELNYLLHVLKFPADHVVCCPDMAGQELWIKNPMAMSENFFKINGQNRHSDFGLDDLKGSFRKPNAGMLEAIVRLYQFEKNLKFDRRVFIGNDDSDRQAAAIAGFDYWDINEWLKFNEIQ